MTDAELKVVVTAVLDGFRQGMAELKNTVQQTTAQASGDFQRAHVTSAAALQGIQHHVESAGQSFGDFRERVSLGLSGLSGQIRAFGEAAAAGLAVLAGERAMANVIRSTQDWAFEIEHLHHSLGITTADASVFAVAAKEADVPVHTIDTTLRSLGRTLDTNQQAFANLKIEIRDNRGELLPLDEILTNTVTRLRQYEAGTQRLIATHQVLPRAVAGTTDELKRFTEALAHAQAIAKPLGVLVDERGIANAREYQRAIADLELASLGLKETLAGALRPELTALTNELLRLAEEGKLKEWAEDAAHGLEAVASDIKTVAGFLRDHIDLVKDAAGAWVLYRTALVAAAGITGTVAAFGTLATALQGLQAAGAVGAMLNGLGLSMTAAAAGAASLTAETVGTIGALEAASLGVEGYTAAIAGEVGMLEAASLAIPGMAAAMGGAAVEAGTLAGALALVTGGLSLIAPLVAAGAVAGLVTYAGAWGDVAEGARRAAHELGVLFGILHRSAEEAAEKEVLGLQAALRAAEEEVRGLQERHLEYSGAFVLATRRMEDAQEALNAAVARLGAAQEAALAATTGPEARARHIIELRTAYQTAEHEVEALAATGVRSGAVYEAAVARMTAAQQAFNAAVRDAGGEPEVGGHEKAPKTAKQQTEEAKKAYELLKAEEDKDLANVQHNEARKLEIVEHYTAEMRKIKGLDATQLTEIEKRDTEAVRAAATERVRITEIGAKAEIAATQSKLAIEQKSLEAQKSAGLITERQFTAQMVGLEDRRFEAVQRNLQRELVAEIGTAAEVAAIRERLNAATTPGEKQEILIGVQNPEKVLELFAQLDKAAEEHIGHINELEIKLQTDTLKQQAADIKGIFDGVFGGIESGLQQMVNGVLQGTQSVSQAMARAGENLAAQELALGAKFLLDIVKQEGLRVAARVAGNEAIAAVDKSSTEARAANWVAAELEAGALALAARLGLYQAEQPMDAAVAAYRVAQAEAEEQAKTAVAAEGQAERTAVAETGSETRQGLGLAEVLSEGATSIKKLGIWTAEQATRSALELRHLVTVGAHKAAEFALESAGEVKKLALWIGTQTKKLAVTVLTNAGILADTTVSAAATSAVEATESKKTVADMAAAAAAKAYSAFAEIPIIGPALGAAAAAVTFAAVMALGSVISAERGAEEIGPRGAVAVLHPKEMVLPASVAETIRGLATAPATVSPREAAATSSAAAHAALPPPTARERGREAPEPRLSAAEGLAEVPARPAGRGLPFPERTRESSETPRPGLLPLAAAAAGLAVGLSAAVPTRAGAALQALAVPHGQHAAAETGPEREGVPVPRTSPAASPVVSPAVSPGVAETARGHVLSGRGVEGPRAVPGAPAGPAVPSAARVATATEVAEGRPEVATPAARVGARGAEGAGGREGSGRPGPAGRVSEAPVPPGARAAEPPVPAATTATALPPSVPVRGAPGLGVPPAAEEPTRPAPESGVLVALQGLERVPATPIKTLEGAPPGARGAPGPAGAGGRGVGATHHERETLRQHDRQRETVVQAERGLAAAPGGPVALHPRELALPPGAGEQLRGATVGPSTSPVSISREAHHTSARETLHLATGLPATAPVVAGAPGTPGSSGRDRERETRTATDRERATSTSTETTRDLLERPAGPERPSYTAFTGGVVPAMMGDGFAQQGLGAAPPGVSVTLHPGELVLPPGAAEDVRSAELRQLLQQQTKETTATGAAGPGAPPAAAASSPAQPRDRQGHMGPHGATGATAASASSTLVTDTLREGTRELVSTIQSPRAGAAAVLGSASPASVLSPELLALVTQIRGGETGGNRPDVTAAQGMAEAPAGPLTHPIAMALPSAIHDRVRAMIGIPGRAAGLRDAAAAGGILSVPAEGLTQRLAPGSMVLPAVLADVVRAAASGAPYPGETTDQRLALTQSLGIGGSFPVFHAARGLERVPAGGAVGILHPDEMVLTADVAGRVRGDSPGGTSGVHEPGAPAHGGAGGPGAHGGAGGHAGPGGAGGAGGGGPGGTQHHEHKHTHEHKAAAHTPGITPALAAGGGGGGRAQPVEIVAAKATVSTLAKGGQVTAQITTPVQATPAGGQPLPVQNQGTQTVTVANTPLRVAFSATTMGFGIATSIAPFGIGVILATNFGFMNAYKGGGDVPEDMLAKLHAKEMVLPADMAEGFRHLFRAPDTEPTRRGVRVDVDHRLLNLTSLRDRGDVSSLGANLAAGGVGGEQHQHLHAHVPVVVQALDGASAKRVFDEHARLIAQNTIREMKHGLKG